MWRCFSLVHLNSHWSLIFSTYVEVFLGISMDKAVLSNFLHVCGGVSQIPQNLNTPLLFSPRMWRCFLLPEGPAWECEIFSTYVEVFLCASSNRRYERNFLHVCGGVSESMMTKKDVARIFSTYVEVFLFTDGSVYGRSYFLHVCGGVSIGNTIIRNSTKFSPRMWRCFLWRAKARKIGAIFSTYVEVFLHRITSSRNILHFLHVCGGVSSSVRIKYKTM